MIISCDTNICIIYAFYKRSIYKSIPQISSSLVSNLILSKSLINVLIIAMSLSRFIPTAMMSCIQRGWLYEPHINNSGKLPNFGFVVSDDSVPVQKVLSNKASSVQRWDPFECARKDSSCLGRGLVRYLPMRTWRPSGSWVVEWEALPREA